VDAKTGRVVWSVELGQEFTGCPVVMDARIALGCRGGKLAVLDRATGAVVWQKQVADRFNYDPLPVQARYSTPAKWSPVCDLDFTKLTALGAELTAQLYTDGLGASRATVAAPGAVTLNKALQLCGATPEAAGLATATWAKPVGRDLHVELTVQNRGSILLALGGDVFSGCRVVLDCQAHELSLDTVAGGKHELLAKAERKLPAEPKSLKVVVDKLGPNLTVTVDGQVYLQSAKAGPWADGAPAPFALANFMSVGAVEALKVSQCDVPEQIRQEDVLVHLDANAVKLTRVEDGVSGDLITITVKKEGKDEQAPWTIPGGLLAPISYYRGQLYFVPRQLDHGGLEYMNIYLGVGGGSFIQVVPAAETK